MITVSEITESLAYCGLICDLCFLHQKCDGCKSVINQCERNCSDEGCEQKKCCEMKGYDGCWMCNEIVECNKGIYKKGNSEKIKSFSIVIQKIGKEEFARKIIRNMGIGLSVEKGKDYDNIPIEKVLELFE